MKRYFTNRLVIGTGVIIVIIIAIVILKKPAANTNAQTFVVKSATVSQVVSVTGKVKSANAVDLSFEKSGRITEVYEDVGDRVTAGTVIVQTDDSDLEAQLKQAQGVVAYQKAKLSELEEGTRPEELNITQSKLNSATSSIANAQNNLVLTLQSAYTTAEDAVHNKVDQFFVNARTSNPQLAFNQPITTEQSILTGRVEVEARLNDLSELIATASTSNVATVSTSVNEDMAEIKLFLDNTAIAVDALTPNSYVNPTQVTQWKNDLTLARDNVNGAITSILAGQNTLQSAKNDALTAQSQLNLETAGTVSQEIDAQQAQVTEAQANVDGIYASIAKTKILSPIDGIVTIQNAKVGELASPNAPVVSIISDSEFEIEADVAESDIAKIAVADTAKVTLDAYGPDIIFDAVVVAIDPAETVIDGVPTYKTTLQFKTTDDRIKSGMTANVDIQGASHDNVLAVPERAIVTHNGQKYVTIQTGKTTQDVAVTTGLRGSDGLVEITSGLEEGQIAVVDTQTN